MSSCGRGVADGAAFAALAVAADAAASGFDGWSAQPATMQAPATIVSAARRWIRSWAR
jgi:hypothetical protein